MPDLEKAQPEKESKSVCPIGLTMPFAEKRLSKLPEERQAKDPEHIMMRLWAEQNTRRSFLNFGQVPVDGILHECNEKCGEHHSKFSLVGSPHFFDGKLAERDLRIISATVQYLATNCGREFLGRFFAELKKAHEPKETKDVSVKAQ